MLLKRGPGSDAGAFFFVGLPVVPVVLVVGVAEVNKSIYYRILVAFLSRLSALGSAMRRQAFPPSPLR
jgi:hypothetical protein